jgi:hypothetical protein
MWWRRWLVVAAAAMGGRRGGSGVGGRQGGGVGGGWFRAMAKAAAAAGGEGGGGGGHCGPVGGPAVPWPFLFFLCSEIFFTESHIGLSAKIHRDENRRRGLRRYSVHREAFTESKLSVKAPVRGKGPSPRGIPLSAKTSNPVVARPSVKYIRYNNKPKRYCK